MNFQKQIPQTHEMALSPLWLPSLKVGVHLDILMGPLCSSANAEEPTCWQHHSSPLGWVHAKRETALSEEVHIFVLLIQATSYLSLTRRLSSFRKISHFCIRHLHLFAFFWKFPPPLFLGLSYLLASFALQYLFSVCLYFFSLEALFLFLKPVLAPYQK